MQAACFFKCVNKAAWAFEKVGRFVLHGSAGQPVTMIV
jgi:hypothetical protein